MATVDAMQTANKAMKKQYKGIDIDKIEVSYNISVGVPDPVDQLIRPTRVYITIWRT